MSKKTRPQSGTPQGTRLEKIRRRVELTSTAGLLLVAVALVVPFTNLTHTEFVGIFKWIYAAGALIYTVARVVNVNDPADGRRLKRLRRLEAWAGLAFCIAAGFWFYNAHRFPEQFGYTLSILRDTITFTLVGALIQLISSFLITREARRQQNDASPKA